MVPVVGQMTDCDARGAIYNVSIGNVRQACHMDGPRSSSTNESLIKHLDCYFFEYLDLKVF